jgi:cytochrome c-type biogenesis protein CcmE
MDNSDARQIGLSKSQTVQLGMRETAALAQLGRRRRTFVRPVSIAVVLAAMGYLVFAGLSSATVYYVTVSEFQAQSAVAGTGATGAATKPVRVSGYVVPGSIVRDGALLRFVMADGGGSLPVSYRGVVPDIFGAEIQVVVEGRPDGAGGFLATTLLAKCPSKFEAGPSRGLVA